MTVAAKPKGLHAKLAEVMAEAERIPKNGRAPAAMGGFPFVQVGDAADYIRKALGARGVSMLPSAVEVTGEAEHATKSGGAMTTLTIRTTWTLTDGESGETATIQSIGTGADSGDKASPKAQTNAMKYALLMGFLLSTGDDPEQSDSSDRQPAAVSGGEKAELLGNLRKDGRVEQGSASAYRCEWRETPAGYAVGFRLKVDAERAIPQVLVTGAVGAALYVATSGDGAALIGQRVTVAGRLYGIRQPGRTTYHRLVIGERDDPLRDFIETPDVRIPAHPETAPAVVGATEPSEAPSGELFELDAEERVAVGGDPG